jgi:protein-S-isoprenylcysteine O-methyltransferase Ste14
MIALRDQKQQEIEHLWLHGDADAVPGQLPQLALKFVIIKAKSHQGAPVPLLKQKSGISQAKDNHPGKSLMAQYGILQRSIALTIGAMELPMSQVHTIGPDFSGSRFFKFIAFLYGMASYLVFFVTILYAIGFVMGLVVPKTIDIGANSPVAEAIIVNLLLMSLFAVQHSVMARQGFKAWWTRYVPKPIERSTYVLAASLCLLLLFWQWRPIPTVVWQVANPDFAATVAMISLAGWVLVFASTFIINHFELFGLSQVANNLVGKEVAPPRFRTPLLYKFVRHPIYLGFIIAFWAAPVMTVGHLLFAAVTTAYILVGIWLEERDLIELFGDQYREYKQRVSMLIPWRRSA